MIIVNGSTNLKNISYVFDNAGNLLTKNDTIEGNVTYNYDNLYRLVYANLSGSPAGNYTHNYAYDKLGNILQKEVNSLSAPTIGYRSYTYSASQPHAVISLTGTYTSGTNTDNNAQYSMAYDANGNMTNESISAFSGQTNVQKKFTWDANNKLAAINWQGNIYNYYYDYSGERIIKYQNESSSNSVETLYINGLVQFKNNGNRQYFIFDGVNRIAAKTTVGSASSTFYTHTDHVGSTVLVTTSSGTVYQRIVYAGFGTIYKEWLAGAWQNPSQGDFTEIGSYAFTGQELDQETGLYYSGARYYDPCIGRYISADDQINGVYDTQGFNRYTYAGNNPIVYSDPTGNSWFSSFIHSTVGKLIIGFVISAVLAVVTGGVSALLETAAIETGSALIGGVTANIVNGSKLGGSDFWSGFQIGFAIGTIGVGIATMAGAFGSTGYYTTGKDPWAGPMQYVKNFNWAGFSLTVGGLLEGALGLLFGNNQNQNQTPPTPTPQQQPQTADISKLGIYQNPFNTTWIGTGPIQVQEYHTWTQVKGYGFLTDLEEEKGPLGSLATKAGWLGTTQIQQWKISNQKYWYMRTIQALDVDQAASGWELYGWQGLTYKQAINNKALINYALNNQPKTFWQKVWEVLFGKE